MSKKQRSEDVNPILALREKEIPIAANGGRAGRDVAALLRKEPGNKKSKEEKTLDKLFAKISWRLALRLGYEDQIEVVRASLKRILPDFILHQPQFLNLNNDPIMTEAAFGTMKRDIGEKHNVDTSAITMQNGGSFFGACFGVVAASPGSGYTGSQNTLFWGLSQELYMRPVSHSWKRMYGDYPLSMYNLHVIEAFLNLTVGQYGERHTPSIEEVMNARKERQEALQGLTDKSSLFSRPGLIRRHVFGQPTGFASRSPICGGGAGSGSDRAEP